MAIRTNLANVNLKRTCASLYMNAASPQAYALDANETTDIYPGMVAMIHADGEVKVCSGLAGDFPLGLFANFAVDGVADEITTDPQRMTGVWVGGADAQYSILSPAFDTNATWAVGADGADVLLCAGRGTNNLGKLTPRANVDTAGWEVDADAEVVAKLISVPSTSEIIVAPIR